MSDSTRSANFAITRWTLVERTRGDSPESRAAMRELCEAYYSPIVAFLRSENRTDEQARDLAHEFFAQLLAGDALSSAVRERGRFRSYLLGAVKHFLMNNKRAALSQMRGGGVGHVAIAPGTDTSPGFDVQDDRGTTTDARFDRQWALSIIDRALLMLQKEHVDSGNTQQFALLKSWITPADDQQLQGQIAEQLGISEGAVKVAIHRLRKRFRELVRHEVSQTLNDPADLNAEMQHLILALASDGW